MTINSFLYSFSMKTIIVQYNENDDISSLIEETLKIESSSKASLARRAIYTYCKKLIENSKPKNGN